VAALLQGWDGDATSESVPASLYHVFLHELTRALFEAKVGKGWMAYAPDADGGTQIRRFDPRADEIVLQPAIAGG
jgi:acyl-homoserine lactone acylase PvdQ